MSDNNLQNNKYAIFEESNRTPTAVTVRLLYGEDFHKSNLLNVCIQHTFSRYLILICRDHDLQIKARTC